MGISRSATVVCAYLVATTSMTAREAVDFAISKRAIVCPNLGFRRQLEAYSIRFYSRKSFAAKSAARITGVSEGIAARIKKLKRGNRGDARFPQEDGEEVNTTASAAVTVSSVHLSSTVVQDVSPSIPAVE